MTTLITRLRARPVPSIIAAVALVLALMLGVTAWVLKSSLEGTGEVVNTAGGYRIEVPDGWSSTQEGRTTTVRSPEGDTVVTFGLGHPGSLEEAGSLFFQEVGRNYRKVQVFPPEAKYVGRLPALAYSGAGINKQDIPIRFLAITVQGEPKNYAIAVYTHVDSDPQRVLPKVNEVVDSFRTLPPS